MFTDVHLIFRSQQQNVQEEIMKKFREIVREASQAVYGNKLQGGKSKFYFLQLFEIQGSQL